MKTYSNIFSISVQGSRENIVRMLNAAIRNVGTGDVIVEDDDIDTINIKTLEENEIYRLRVAIQDLMDEQCLKDSIIQEKKHDFDTRMLYYEDVLAGKVIFDSLEDEEYAWCKAEDELENMCDGRFIDFCMIYETEYGFEVKMEYYVGEEPMSAPDWADWTDVCRLYGCKVVIDDEQYLNDCFDEFCGTTIYEMVDGKVKETHIAPKLNLTEYASAFDILVRMNPDRYRKKKICDMKDKIRALQAEISGEELLLQLELLDKTAGHLCVPDGVTHLSEALWPYADKLRSIYIPASVVSINKHAISASSLESIEISPDNPNFCSVNNCILDKDKTRLLIGCKGSVVPDGITEIEDSAFSGCSGLEKITIPSHVKRVGCHAFSDCSCLSQLVIEDGVEILGFSAFSRCTALTSVALPDSLDNLPVNTFGHCTSLSHVTLPKRLEEMAGEAFENTPWSASIEMPE